MLKTMGAVACMAIVFTQDFALAQLCPDGKKEVLVNIHELDLRKLKVNVNSDYSSATMEVTIYYPSGSYYDNPSPRLLITRSDRIPESSIGVGFWGCRKGFGTANSSTITREINFESKELRRICNGQGDVVLLGARGMPNQEIGLNFNNYC